MAVGTEIHRRSMARAVDLTLEYPVEANQVAYIDQFLGITFEAGEYGDTIALDIERQIIDVELPSAVMNAVEVGDIVYVIIANVVEHGLPDNAYTLTEGSNMPFLKVTRILSDTAVSGVLLPVGV